jgi:hypothetical protein
VESTCLRARGIAQKDPQRFSRQEETARRDAGPRLAYANCRKNRAIRGDIILHESLECFSDAMDCVWRLKAEAVGEVPIGRRVPGLGLIYEGLTETFFQHATSRTGAVTVTPYIGRVLSHQRINTPAVYLCCAQSSMVLTIAAAKPKIAEAMPASARPEPRFAGFSPLRIGA